MYADNNDVSADFFPLVDPSVPTFGERIRIAGPIPDLDGYSPISLLPDEVLVLEANGDLVRFALPDLTKTVLQAAVVTFTASDDAHYLLYQLSPNSGDDPYNPIGTILISDRSSGTSVPVGTGSLGLASPFFRVPAFARVQLRGATDHQRLISLPDFEFIDASEGHELEYYLPDGRWLTTLGHSSWSVLDMETGQATLVSATRGQPRAYTDDHLDLFLSGHYDPQHMRPLVRYFFDGSEPQTLATRANVDAIVREDGRVLTMVDVDDDWIGELTLVDPSTKAARRIDDRVIAGTNLKWWRHPTEPDAIVYGVVDGDRSGVWLARPAPID